MYVAFEGNTGAGKTTVAQLVAKALGYACVLEPGSHELDSLYDRIEEEPLAVQLHCLAHRITGQHAVRAHRGGGVVTDFHFLKDKVYADIWLSGESHAAYCELFHSILSLAEEPDLLVVLGAPTDELLARSAQRDDREFETFVDAEFLDRLQAAMNANLLHAVSCPRVTIDTTQLPWPLNPEDVLKQIGLR